MPRTIEREKMFFDCPALYFKSTFILRAQIWHSGFYDDDDQQWQNQRLLVSRRLCEDFQLLVEHSWYWRQIYSLDKWCNTEELRVVWKIRARKQTHFYRSAEIHSYSEQPGWEKCVVFLANLPKDESKCCIIQAIASDVIKCSFLNIDPKRLINNFEVFGLDFMVDSNYKPWLIEVNTNPCLELSCPILERIIPHMV